VFDGQSGQLRIRHQIARDVDLLAQSLVDARCGLGRGWDPHHGDCEPLCYISPRIRAGQWILGDSWMGGNSEECTDRLPGQADSAIAGKHVF